MKRGLLSLVLALTLLLGLQAAALAASGSGGTALVCQTGGNGVELGLTGLDGGVYGVQVELALRGQYPQCTFTGASGSGTAYTPDCTVAVSGQETYVTIYLTDESPLNSGSGLALGTLRLGAPAAGDLLPAAARVKLLDHGLSASVDGAVPVTDGAGVLPQPPQPGRPSQPTTPVAPNNPGQGVQNPGGEDSGTQSPGEGPDHGSVVLPFVDVKETDWFCEAVRYVYAKGMMGGTGADTFSPGATTTRAMIVTILHRLEGSPEGPGSVFTDVPAGQYYTGAVGWASSVGVVNGYEDGAFRPDDPITREQMAAILCRYAQYKGVDVSRRADLTRFPDSAKVSPYAVESMGWAVETGLITGMDGLLAPGGSATRAQIATILMRLCENVVSFS